LKIISREQYYVVLCYFILACQRQAEVQKLEKDLVAIIGDGRANDKIYDPNSQPTKEEFDVCLLDMGIQVDWKPEKKRADEKENIQ
jgi:hypothetical protein